MPSKQHHRGCLGIAFPFKPCNSHRNLLAWRRTPQQIDQTCGERLQGHPRGAAPSVGAQLARVRRVLAWGAWELHSHSNPAAPFAIGSTGVDPQRKSTKPAAGQCDPGPPQGKKPSAGEKALRRRNGGPGGSAPWYFAFHNSNIRIKSKKHFLVHPPTTLERLFSNV